jgi:hypothetical protein
MHRVVRERSCLQESEGRSMKTRTVLTENRGEVCLQDSLSSVY